MRTYKGREYIRHPAAIPIVVKARDCQPPVSDKPSSGNPSDNHSNQPTTNNLALNNVSQGGLAFDSPTELETGTVVDIEIDIVDSAFEVQGVVQWCRAKESTSTAGYTTTDFEVGVEFVDHEDIFRVRMIEQICHIEQYRLEQIAEGHDISDQKAALEWITKHAAEFPNPNEPKPTHTSPTPKDIKDIDNTHSDHPSRRAK